MQSLALTDPNTRARAKPAKSKQSLPVVIAERLPSRRCSEVEIKGKKASKPTHIHRQAHACMHTHTHIHTYLHAHTNTHNRSGKVINYYSVSLAKVDVNGKFSSPKWQSSWMFRRQIDKCREVHWKCVIVCLIGLSYPQQQVFVFVCLFVLLWKPYRPRPHYRESK